MRTGDRNSTTPNATDQERAIAIGKGVLQGNARRLYGDRLAN